VVATISKKSPIRVLSGEWGEPWENKHTQLYARVVDEVLCTAGYNVSVLECSNSRDLCEQMTDDMIAYNCLFGHYGEDGTIAALLEFLRIPYTGSGPLASALSMDKARCAAFLTYYNIPSPRTILLEAECWPTLNEMELVRLLERRGWYPGKRHEAASKYTFIVKPNRSSFGSGITALSNFDEFQEAFRQARMYSDTVVVQEFIEGMTVYIPVICGKALTPVEVVPTFVDGKLPSDSFRPSNRTYKVPTGLDDSLINRLRYLAELAYRSLGCRGLARLDFQVRDDGEVYFLELNSQHSIRPNGIVLMSAQSSGLSTLTLVESILEDRWVPYQKL
jgi:D-alanine-D-alanine ligase